MHLKIKRCELRLQFMFDLSQQSILNLPRRSQPGASNSSARRFTWSRYGGLATALNPI